MAWIDRTGDHGSCAPGEAVPVAQDTPDELTESVDGGASGLVPSTPVTTYCPHCNEEPPLGNAGWRYKLCDWHRGRALQVSQNLTREQIRRREAAKQDRERYR